MSQRKIKRFQVLCKGVFALLLVVLGILSIWKAHAAWQQTSCGVTVEKAWDIAFSLYRSDLPDKQYPPMSVVPGRLFLEFSDVYPSYVTEEGHPLFCEASGRAFKGLSLEEKFTHSTYVYFGYVLQSEDEILAFLDAYPEFLEKGVDFKSDLPAPEGRGSFGGDQFVRLSQDHHPKGPGLKRPTPLLIEIPDYEDEGLSFRHPKPGGYVSFLGGGALFVDYGSRFPMTSAVIEKIGELKMRYLK